MGGNEGVGQIPSTNGLPYREGILYDEVYTSYSLDPCPQCGSKHQTITKSFFSPPERQHHISGDLHMKTLLVGKCLKCGFERPVKFICIREA
jgi:hypothetical protein